MSDRSGTGNSRQIAGIKDRHLEIIPQVKELAKDLDLAEES